MDEREEFEKWESTWNTPTKWTMPSPWQIWQAATTHARTQREENVARLVKVLNAILDAPIIYTGCIEEPMRTCGMDAVQPFLDAALVALLPFTKELES